MTNRIYPYVISTAAVFGLGTAAIADGPNFTNDVFVQGSICAGVDCTFGANLGTDTLRLEEDNLRIKFLDTSGSGSFPGNDWQITINDATNGGADKFSIDDIDGGSTPFTILAGAPSHSIFVASGGDVGLGQNAPVTNLHITDGDTPTLRLEQDTSSTFQAQTFDISVNETNFFIRDVTNGSQPIFRIRPGAAESSIDIASDGDVFMGLPADTTHAGDLVVGGAGIKLIDLVSTDNTAVQYRLVSTSSNRRLVALTTPAGPAESQVILHNSEIRLAGANDSSELWATVDTDGIELPSGSTFSVNGTSLNVPDYVFDGNYPLMPLDELANFIGENKHLPRVPSADDVRENGLNMTEMQLVLLEKVEELTLYTLALERELKAHRDRLHALEQ